MRKSIYFLGLFCALSFPLCAQDKAPQDSLKLTPRLDEERADQVRLELLREFESNHTLGVPKEVTDKAWMDFDNSLPAMPQTPESEIILTLRPYTAHTPYNWDPIFQRKIRVDKDTWRTGGLDLLKGLQPQSNWVGSVEPSGIDLMALFTREFWDSKGRKRRARTLEVLKMYGDSITTSLKKTLKKMN